MTEIGTLEVWWIRNPPRQGERFQVKTVGEAITKLNTLADIDLKRKHVWANVGGLEIYTKDGWEEYYDENGDSIDEIMRNKEEDNL